ncbi:autotransporter-associated beta strand repeat-containing protein [Ereboglobus sp. PH5-10]|uniref:autotransporter-associated beta strand repeat-containing protein n=1 Tax=Ereboglobus sp. PH5-10 TaxID=2940629 RepID=UPI002404951E|nr:autotransporter-associated beta strand repeat-containing protein [Ereboglobus sp. PH5-10]
MKTIKHPASYRMTLRGLRALAAPFLLASLAVQSPSQTVTIIPPGYSYNISSPGSYALSGTIGSGSITGSMTGVTLIIYTGARVNSSGNALNFLQGGADIYNSGTVISSSDYGVFSATNPSSVTNYETGLIQGRSAGIYMRGGGTVTNTGRIIGTLYYGITGSGVITITNSAAGLIKGDSTGIYINYPPNDATLMNSGSIVGTKATGVSGVRSITNGTTGLIQGFYTGISDVTTLVNDGTITITNTDPTEHKVRHAVNISNGSVTNNETGLIRGYSTGIYMSSSGTVENSGTILSDTYKGIDSISHVGTTIVNATTGLIQGLNHAISFYDSGTVTNSGSIISLYDGINGWKYAVITNNDTGLIRGLANGITMRDGSTVTNSGTIIGTGSFGINARLDYPPVYLDVAITNNATGLIQGGVTGIYFEDSGTVTNSGIITGSRAYGVRTGSDSTIIITAGLVQGGSAGIFMGDRGTVTNEGVITGSLAYGIAAGADATITNSATGVIRGGTTGILMGSGGVVTNSGTIIGERARSIFMGAGGVVTNSGAIIGSGDLGLEAGDDTTITNNAAGLIQGGTFGISLGADGAVTNYGVISSDGNGSSGILMGDGGTVTNSGTIKGVGYNASGITVTDNAIITNSSTGLIQGEWQGVYLKGGGTITNSGTIHGEGTEGISGWSNLTITNDIAGLIHGRTLGISLWSSGTVINSGTIFSEMLYEGIDARENATITNNATGLIQGGGHGVKVGNNSTVLNSGTIIGGDYTPPSAGVAAGHDTTITNAATGLIRGDAYGISLGDGGTITNSGRVTGTDAASYGIAGGNNVTITNSTSGLIQGVAGGISLLDGGTITNSGTIIGGIEAGINTTITNSASGLARGMTLGDGSVVVNSGTTGGITGGDDVTITGGAGLIQGISLGAGGTVTNDGKITEGITAGDNATIINNATGRIETFGERIILLGDGGSITNSGTIINIVQELGVTGGDDITITNNATGLIHADFDAISLGDGATITNAGTITGESSSGINSGVDSTITNAATGLIQGGVTSIYLGRGGVVTNSGTIIGTRPSLHGIQGGDNITVTNSTAGLIRGGRNGIFLRNGGVITNSGSIIGELSDGVSGYDGLTITNTTGGLIQGGIDGISLGSDGTVTNSGMIIGTGLHGIKGGDNTTITNASTGLIQGGSIGVSLGINGALVNSGTIIGEIGAGEGTTITNDEGVIQYLSMKDGGGVINRGVILDGISAGDDTTISNAADSLIRGGTAGILLGDGGVVANSGTILGTGSEAYGVTAANNTLVTNTTGGLIEGIHGVRFVASGTVLNAGVISGTGANGAGVYSNGAATLVSNTTGGLISGNYRGVYLGGGGIVLNAGTISGPGAKGPLDSGVSSNANATLVSNTTGGLVLANYYGVHLIAGGTVLNAGTITGVGVYGIGVYSNSNATLVRNTTGGLIQGVERGIALWAGGTVFNSGTVSGTYGVYSHDGVGSVDNAAGGLIQGVTRGVQLAGGGIVANSGAIAATGASGFGVHSSSNATLVSNTTGALIQAGLRGVSLGGGGTLTNAGTISGTGAGGYGVYSLAADTLVDNATSGLIRGGFQGVYLSNGGTVTNSGTIRSANDYAVRVNNGGAHITNTGVIDGGIHAGGTTNVDNQGLVSGGRGTVIGADSTLANTGTIDVTGIAVIFEGAADFDNQGLVRGSLTGVRLNVEGGTLTNSGRIIGTGSSGISGGNDMVITNSATGLIQGGRRGISLQDGGTVTNSGTIVSTQNQSQGIYAGGNSTITNNATGLIQGDWYGISLGDIFLAGVGNGMVTNSGTIISASDGIQAYSNATITNHATGLIQGDYGGISLWSSGTIINSGTIICIEIGCITSHSLSSPATTTITNHATGLIQGAFEAIFIEDRNTITNTGTILGVVSDAIHTRSIDTVITNTNAGLIRGGHAGISLWEGGTVTNSSTILGMAGTGISVDGDATITNHATGLVQGGTGGISLWTGTMINSSTIIGEEGVGFYGGYNVIATNHAAALIQGGGDGALMREGGTLTNSGTILGTGSAGIRGGPYVTIINNAAGLVQGGADGIWVRKEGWGSSDDYGTVTNSGTIIGTESHGIGGEINLIITNSAIGLIQGGSAGVFLENSGMVANSGTIRGVNDYAVRVNNGEAEITNTAAGVIDGGIYAGGITTVDNKGLVTGERGAVIGVSSTLANTGTIDVTGTAVIFEGVADFNNQGLVRGSLAGVHLVVGGTVANSGTIIGTEVHGIEGDDSSIIITNAVIGLIQGGTAGISLASGGTVFNAGVISGSGASNVGIYSDSAATLVSNTTGGLIRGVISGVDLLAGGTVLNSGTISGYGIEILGYGVYSHAGIASVVNAPGGLIHGVLCGIHLGGGGTIANSGTIGGNFGVETVGNAAFVSNTTGGLIWGINRGVYLAAGGTVLNAGTISGTGANAHGVYFLIADTFMENAVGGLIHGVNYGVFIPNGGTLANSGTIRGVKRYAVNADRGVAAITNAGVIDGGIYAGGTTNVGNQGLVSGSLTGVHLGISSTVANSGTIIGTGTESHGIYAVGTVAITNTTGGLIQGAVAGVHMQGGGTVTNAGVLSGTRNAFFGGGYGVYAANAAAHITNEATGLLRGESAGLALTVGGVIINSGSILSTAFYNPDAVGIQGGGARVQLTNHATGLIWGDRFGVRLTDGGEITNSGTIESNEYAVTSVNESMLVSNTTGGLILSERGGVLLQAGGTVLNSGTIDSAVGIHALNTGVAIANATGGLIQGGTLGIRLQTGGEVTNSGTIIGGAATGVSSRDEATITNDATGLIQGGMFGIFLGSGGTVTNSGAIRAPGVPGDFYAFGIESEDEAVITNNAGGLIQGADVGVGLVYGGTLTNSGTISGITDSGVLSEEGRTVVMNMVGGVIRGGEYAVDLLGDDDEAHEVHLWNSSTLAGKLSIAGTASQLVLNGASGSEQAYTSAVTGLTTFTGTLVKQGAGSWLMDTGGIDMRAVDVREGLLTALWDITQLNAAAVNIAADATLAVRATTDATLANTLTGGGLVNLLNTSPTDAVTFSLQPFSPSALSFTGTIGVGGDAQMAVFNFNDAAETTLADATLWLADNSETTLNADRSIGGLNLDGGTFIVKTDTASASGVEPHLLTVKTLYVNETDLTASTTIGIDTDLLSGVPQSADPRIGLAGNIFDIDVVKSGSFLRERTIVHSTESGPEDGIAFDLVDSNGDPIHSGTSSITYGEDSGGGPVGKNTYGYNAITQDGDILLNHGLVSIESLSDIENIVIDPADAIDDTLSAQLTGAGAAGFAFTGSRTIVLGHTDNDYTGATLITGSATLTTAGIDNVIASSTSVTITAGAAFDTDNTDQALRNLSGAGAIHIGDGSLDIINNTAGLVFSGTIDGAGALTLAAGGALILTGNNTHTGLATIETAAHLQLGAAGEGGGASGMIASAAVANSGTLTFNRSDAVTYAGAITGAGDLVQLGGGATTLTGANALTGNLVVKNGSLQIGSGATDGWAGGVIAANAQISSGATLFLNRSDRVTATGTIDAAGYLRGAGDLQLGDAGAGGVIMVAGSGSVNIAGAYVQNARSSLALDASGRGLADAFVVASSATVGGTLSVRGFAAGSAGSSASAVLANNNQVLLETTTGTISGAFASATLDGFDGSGLPNYLLGSIYKSANARQYLAGMTLSWFGAAAYSHGTFTIGAGDTFNVDVAIGNTTAHAGWDGKSLTKLGEGALILSASNTYTGTTLVSGGSLDITNWTGATARVLVGGAAGTSGTLNVSGYLGGASDLYVADQGAAAMTISGSGVVQNTTGAIGNNTNGVGVVTVGGSGHWLNTGILSVGRYGSGSLAIVGSGSVQSATAYIGRFASGKGAVTVSGSGLWNNTGNLFVGNSGTGRLSISDGGRVTIGGTYRQNAMSTLALDATARDRDDAFVVASSATVGGTLSVSGLSIGADFSKASDVLANNNQVLLETTTGTISGAFASATLDGFDAASLPDYIQGGIRKSANARQYLAGVSLSWLGDAPGSHGTFTIDAGDTFDVDVPLADTAAHAGWDGKSLTKLGAGALILSASNTHTGTTFVNGGTLNITDWTGGNTRVIIGETAGDNGTVNVSGYLGVEAGLSNNGYLYVGHTGAGGLAIVESGSVKSAFGFIGAYAGGVGSATVSGSGFWNNRYGFYVGANGSGTLTIAGSGSVQSDSGEIGAHATGVGSVTVGGSGFWNNTQSLTIGNNGAGGLRITESGGVRNTIGYIGNNSVNSTGTVTVDGSGFWNNTGDLHVGRTGAGILMIAGSGSVQAVNGYVGNIANSNGSVTVGGSGYFNNTGNLRVGNSGTGRMAISGGGGVQSASADIGYAANGNGSVTVDDSGHWNITSMSGLYVGRSGTGSLEIAGSGSVQTTHGYIGRNANSHGRVTVSGSGYFNNANNLRVGYTGVGYLGVSGSGLVNVVGTYQQNAASTLALDASGRGLGDAFVIASAATVGGTLSVTGFTIGPDLSTAAEVLANGTQVLLKTTTGVISGTFDSATLAGFDAASLPDYLYGGIHKSADAKRYLAGVNLSWFGNGAPYGHGNFTLGSGKTFEVDVVLGNTTAHAGWDGKSLVKLGEGTLILSAENTHTGTTLVSEGVLRAGTANAIASSTAVVVNGVFDLNNYNQRVNNLSGDGAVTLGTGTLTVNATRSSTFSGLVSGDGALVKEGDSTLALTSGNTYSGDTFVNNGELSLGASGALGATGAARIAQTGTLTLALSDAAFSNAAVNAGVLLVTGSGVTLASDITGSGTNRIENLDTNITGDNTGFDGLWHIAADGSATVTAQDNLGAAATRVDGVLTVGTSSDWTYANALGGSGVLAAELGGSGTFRFAVASAAFAGDNFTGAVLVKNGSFLLDDDTSETALRNATLRLGASGSASIASNREIAGIDFDGGAFVTRMVNNVITGTLMVGHLGATGTGTIVISGSGPIDFDADEPSPASFFDQDGGENLQQVITAAVVDSGAGAQLTVTTISGSALSGGTAAISKPVIEAGGTLGTAYYDYFAVVSDEDGSRGVYLTYGLKRLDADAGKTIVLDNTGADATLGAQLTGSGNFDMRAAGVAFIGNALSNYTGTTTITSGTVIANTDNAFGLTSLLELAAGAGVDLDGNAQTVGAFNGAATSTLNLNSGALTILSGGTSSGALTGGGTLALTGGMFDVTNSNSEFTAAIENSGTLKLREADAVGATGAIENSNLVLFDAARGVFAKSVNGDGNVQLSNSATITLAGANAITASGSFIIDADSRLIASEAANTGAATIANSGVFVADNAATWDFANALVGTGTLVKQNTGNLVIARANENFTGDTLVTTGTLTAAIAGALGSSDVGAQPAGVLVFDDFDGAVSNNISGGGAVIVGADADLSIAGENTGFAGAWLVRGTGTMTSQDNLGVAGASGATVEIDGGRLALLGMGGDYIFNHRLVGASGELLVDNAGGFGFGAASVVGANYSGTVRLQNNTFALGADNASALANASLLIGDGNITTVATGSQRVGNLMLESGTIRFALDNSGTAAAGFVDTNALHVGDTVLVVDTGSFNNVLSLLRQDEGLGVQLVKSVAHSGKTALSGAQLVDQFGNELGDATQRDITRGDTVTASGTYNFTATADEGGLFLGYTLTHLRLLTSQTTLLDKDTAFLGGDELHALVSGDGNLQINADGDTGVITLGNDGNTYTGATLVTGGTLKLGASGALGQTSLLELAAGAGADLDGNAQTVGAFNGAATSTLNLNSGALTILSGGTSSGALTGGGTLALIGGVLDVTNSNSGFTAAIENSGTLKLREVDAVGATGAIENSNLVLFDAARGVFAKSVNGDGNVQLSNSATITLAGANAITASGSFIIDADSRLIASEAANTGAATIANSGVFVADNAATWNFANALTGAGELVKQNTGNLVISRANENFTGDTLVTGGTLTLAHLGGIGDGNVTNNAVLALTAAGAYANTTANAGLLDVRVAGVDLAADISGSGTNRIASGASATVGGDNSGFDGKWDIIGDMLVGEQDHLGAAATDVSGTLRIESDTAPAWTYENVLTGAGVVAVDLDGGALNFAASAGADFNGALNLVSTRLDFGNDAAGALNERALARATVRAGADSNVRVARAGAIGGLTMDGGTLSIAMDALNPAHVFKTGTLAVADSSSKVIFEGFSEDLTSDGTLPPPTNFLDQDDPGANAVKLLDADIVTQEGQMEIRREDGSAIGAGKKINYDGVVIANYEYAAVATATNAMGGRGAGLYYDYLLTELDIQGGKTLALDTTGAANSVLDARVTGEGGLRISATGGIITLNNSGNDYAGETVVTADSVLVTGKNNALGNNDSHTSLLRLENNTTTLIGNTAQIVGALHTAASSTVALGFDGALTIVNGGVAAGTLTGGGTLELRGGTLTVTSANTGFDANITIAESAMADLKDVAALGASNITVGGTLRFDVAADGAIANTLAGAGEIIKTNGGAAVIATANAGFLGSARVERGRLVLEDIAALNTADISVADGATLEYRTAAGVMGNTVTGPGTLAITTSDWFAIEHDNEIDNVELANAVVHLRAASALGGATARVDARDDSAIWLDIDNAQLGATTLDNSKLGFVHSGPAFRRATLASLSGDNGSLVFNVDFSNATGLKADGEVADHFAITNGSAVGAHTVAVNPVSADGIPAGGETAIPLITDAGAATYRLEGEKIDFGLASFELNKGSAVLSALSLDPDKWYLLNTGLSDVADSIINTASMLAKDWHYSLDALHLRMGHARAELAGVEKPTGNLWLRGRGYYLNANNTISGRGFDQHAYGLTAGGDKAFRARSSVNLLGGFVDMGNIDRDFDAAGGEGETRNLSAGLYATWLRDNGWFADLVLKVDRYKNSFEARTTGGRLVRGDYNSNAQGVSLEFGRRLENPNGWWVEPGVQVAVAWLNSASYRTTPESVALDVKVDGSRAAQYRGQVRVGRQLTNSKWSPYGKIGVVRTDTDGGKIHANEKTFAPDYDGWRFEAGFGASYLIDPRSQVYLDYEYNKAGAYERPWSLNLGYRRLW